MTVGSRLLIDFRSIFGSAPASSSPQPGEFEPADPADVCNARLELERHKRRLNEITPVPRFPLRDGVDL